MRPAVIVFGAIGAIEVALVRYIKAALQWFAVEETLTGFHDVIAGKFAANVFKKFHAAWIRLSIAKTLFRRKDDRGWPSLTGRALSISINCLYRECSPESDLRRCLPCQTKLKSLKPPRFATAL